MRLAPVDGSSYFPGRPSVCVHACATVHICPPDHACVRDLLTAGPLQPKLLLQAQPHTRTSSRLPCPAMAMCPARENGLKVRRQQRGHRFKDKLRTLWVDCAHSLPLIVPSASVSISFPPTWLLFFPMLLSCSLAVSSSSLHPIELEQGECSHTHTHTHTRFSTCTPLSVKWEPNSSVGVVRMKGRFGEC